MRLPQVSERIKEAPAQALRGVFAGIGQLLLVTDKLRNKAPGHAEALETRAPQPPKAPEPSGPVADSAASGPGAEPEEVTPAERAPERAPETQRDFDKTGNVRLLTEEAVEPEAPAPAPPAELSALSGAAAPLPNYDGLTVASLRARLRNLSVDQVRQLAEYERAHAGRPEVITMFERRVAKLEADA